MSQDASVLNPCKHFEDNDEFFYNTGAQRAVSLIEHFEQQHCVEISREMASNISF